MADPEESSRTEEVGAGAGRVRAQRRGGRIAMSPEERDEFLRSERTLPGRVGGQRRVAAQLGTLVRLGRGGALVEHPRPKPALDQSSEGSEGERPCRRW